MHPSRLPLAACVLSLSSMLALTACDFTGADDPDREAADQSSANANEDPDFAEFAEVDLADARQRPQMQLQVVLDAHGFGPGVIDGGMGISTVNALKSFQEVSGLSVTGELDQATRQALSRWSNVPATRVVRIPDSWSRLAFGEVPEEYADQAKLDSLGYESLDEKLAERFHTTVEVLRELNPGGRPAGMPGSSESASAEGVPAYPPRTRVTPTPRPTAAAEAAEPMFRPGQLVRVPNIGLEAAPGPAGDDQVWARTLASLGIAADQPDADRIVVDESEGRLRAYEKAGKLLAAFTVTSGSQHDPLPLGEWGINGVDRNPPFRFDPDLFWDVPDSEEEQMLPPGPNGPVGVVWIDLTKEHYGIHGTPNPETIGRTQSHGCVRLTNWDAARLAEMVSGSTKVVFQA